MSEVFYNDTITVFNRVDNNDAYYWYPTVMDNVHLIMDKASMMNVYGEKSQDNARVFIKYVADTNGHKIINGKQYVLPKEWRNLSVDGNYSDFITFQYGNEFDFIYAGDWNGTDPIADANYTTGFYNYMNKNYDNVFDITSVSVFKLLPHFEITAR